MDADIKAALLRLLDASEGFVVEHGPQLLADKIMWAQVQPWLWLLLVLALWLGVLFCWVLGRRSSDLGFQEACDAASFFLGAMSVTPLIGFWVKLFTALHATYAPHSFLYDELMRGLQ